MKFVRARMIMPCPIRLGSFTFQNKGQDNILSPTLVHTENIATVVKDKQQK